MDRLKFLVFAVLVLALWGAHLGRLPQGLSARALDLASSQASTVPYVVAQRMTERRLQLQKAALVLATAPEVTAVMAIPKGGKMEAPTAEKLAIVRSALILQVPEDVRGQLVVAMYNDVGQLIARGDAPPVREGLDLAALGGADKSAISLPAFGTAHLFHSIRVHNPDKTEPKILGTLVVGGPVLDEKIINTVGAELGVAAIAVLEGGKPVLSAGPDKGEIEALAKAIEPGKTSVVKRGATTKLGPLSLPLLTAGDLFGGQGALLVASRQPILSTPYEVAAVISVQPFMAALGDAQRSGLFITMSVLLLTGVFGFLIGLGRNKKETEAAAHRAASSGRGSFRTPVVEAEPSARAASREPQQAAWSGSGEALSKTVGQDPAFVSSAVESAPADPQAADEFPFPLPPSPDAAPVPEEAGAAFQSEESAEAEAAYSGSETTVGRNPYSEEFGNEPIPDAPAAHPYDAASPFESDSAVGTGEAEYPAEPASDAMPWPGEAAAEAPPEEAPELAPALAASADSYAAQQAQYSDYSQEEPEFNPEATRVAAIPADLLRAASAAATPEKTTVHPPPASVLAAMPRVAAAGGSGEDGHFQEVFREFVTTREKCGELADGLTYEKFVVKLRKNREQLVQKYNCRTVRFQVYVKEGRAALKATPVRD